MKNLWLKFKKWFLALFFGTVVIAAGVNVVDITPQHLKIKPNKKIFEVLEIDDLRGCKKPGDVCVNYGKVKKYKYVSNNKKLNVINPSVLRKQLLDGKIETTFFQNVQFVLELETGDWYELGWATTTDKVLEKYNKKNKKISWLGKTVYAAESVFYPDPHPETNTFDGDIEIFAGAGAGWSWATFRGQTDRIRTDSGTSMYNYISSDTGTNNWRQYIENIILFDTAIIPDTDVISVATLSLHGAGSTFSGLGIDIDIGVYSSNPASDTGITQGDRANNGTTLFSDTIARTSWNTGDYNVLTLNATGRAAVNKTGITKLSTGNNNYFKTDNEPSWSSNTTDGFDIYTADRSGTADDPKLTVTHAPASAGEINRQSEYWFK